MTITELFIYILATWRISVLFVYERGPFDVFVKLREFAGITHDENGTAIQIPDGFFSQLLSCVWCCSVWVAFGMTLFWLLFPDQSLYFATVFAITAGSIIIDRLRPGSI